MCRVPFPWWTAKSRMETRVSPRATAEALADRGQPLRPLRVPPPGVVLEEERIEVEADAQDGLRTAGTEGGGGRGQLGQHVEDVGHDAVVGHLEDGRVRVLVDGDDHL